jgi:beta-lactamase superfamily II metal-dependent hydrolase
MWSRYAVAAACLVPLPIDAEAQDATARVVDVGPGLCVVISIPGGYDMLYDAGHWNSSTCRTAVSELVADERVELVVLSHSDGDHLGELPEVLGVKRAGVVLMTGSRREDTAAYRNAIRAIGDAVADNTTVLNLETWPIAPGTDFFLGPARVTFLAGWNQWDASLSDRTLSSSERRNAISIVMRLEYAGRSILLGGDTVGRAIDAPPETCGDAERFMVDRHGVALRSDVLIAGHHGADNASSTCFIEAVAPEFVVFSAGHDHEHPRQAAAQRFLAAGVPLANLFRTDRGDDEGADEWAEGRIAGCQDRRGDDDIEILLPVNPAQPVSLTYRSASSNC